jgi:hypothetical protein
MFNHKPFAASGTSTFPGHRFQFTAIDDPDTVLQQFFVKEYPENIYVYDPYYVPFDARQTEINLQVLNKEERAKYNKWRQTLLFNEQYKNVTGRSYLANYLRAPPMHYMWRADYFGQMHWVTTKETHFVELPPADVLDEIEVISPDRILLEDQPRLLSECTYDNLQTLNLSIGASTVTGFAFCLCSIMSTMRHERSRAFEG